MRRAKVASAKSQKDLREDFSVFVPAIIHTIKRGLFVQSSLLDFTTNLAMETIGLSTDLVKKNLELMAGRF